jgi:hypothetical protein
VGKKEDKAKERRDRGQTYLTELLARVPEDRREAIKEELTTDEILDHVGDGVLRQSEYSRVMNEQRKAQEALQVSIDKYDTLYADNIKWRASQADGVTAMQAENDRFKTMLAADPLLGGNGDGGGDPTAPHLPADVDLSGYIKREEAEKALKERLEETERNGVQLMAMLSTIQAKHLKQFDEALDAQELFEHANKVHLPLPAAYQDFVKDRVEESRETAHKEAIVQAREEGRMDALKTGTALPHNVGNNEPTVIDVLGMKDRSEFGLNKAVDDYWQMQTAKKNAS